MKNLLCKFFGCDMRADNKYKKQMKSKSALYYIEKIRTVTKTCIRCGKIKKYALKPSFYLTEIKEVEYESS